MANETKSNAMADMAMTILNSLSGMNAEFSFNFENMEVQLPAKGDAPETQIRVNGTLRIQTKGTKSL